VSAKPGSILRIARELVRLYGLLVAVALPLLAGLAVGLIAGTSAPDGLADNARYAEWKDVYGTCAQVIATLLVALVVEAHSPFVRTGALAVRVCTSLAGVLLGIAGLSAVVGLSPSLPGCVYPVLLGLAVGGTAAGLTAVVVLGVGITLGTLRKVDDARLTELQKRGQPEDAEDLFKRRGV
jgi:hypothetical protein